MLYSGMKEVLGWGSYNMPKQDNLQSSECHASSNSVASELGQLQSY